MIVSLVIGFSLTVFCVGALWAQHELQEKTRRRFASSWDTSLTPTFTFQALTATTADGLHIYFRYTPAKDANAIVIIAHGFGLNGEKVGLVDTVEMLHNAGYGTALVDLRGVGRSDGNGEKFGFKEWQDFEAVYDTIKNLPENKDRKIGFLGESMGGATAIITAGKTDKGDFVIAAAPFTNLRKIFILRMIRRKIPIWIGLPFLQLAARSELGFHYRELSPDSLIQKIHVPIFIAWATHDKVIGDNQGSFLFEKANEPKEGWEANTDHDIVNEGGDLFNKKILAFLGKYTTENR